MLLFSVDEDEVNRVTLRTTTNVYRYFAETTLQ